MTNKHSPQRRQRILINLNFTVTITGPITRITTTIKGGRFKDLKQSRVPRAVARGLLRLRRRATRLSNMMLPAPRHRVTHLKPRSLRPQRRVNVMNHGRLMVRLKLFPRFSISKNVSPITPTEPTQFFSRRIKLARRLRPLGKQKDRRRHVISYICPLDR